MTDLTAQIIAVLDSPTWERHGVERPPLGWASSDPFDTDIVRAWWFEGHIISDDTAADLLLAAMVKSGLVKADAKWDGYRQVFKFMGFWFKPNGGPYVCHANEWHDTAFAAASAAWHALEPQEVE